MSTQTKGRLGSFVGLLSFAIAACSGIGEDDLVTVGVRPTGGVAASGGQPGSEVMTISLDGDRWTARGAAGSGAPDASAGTFASTPAEPRGGAVAPPAAGVGGVATGMAGAGGSLGSNEDECGARPAQPAGNAPSGRVSGSGLIEYDVRAPNVFTGLRTRLAVPAEPAPNGPIFVWPGIQPAPNGMNFEPIGNGALLSALTWGALCPPDAPESYSTWWIAPMYSNLSTADPQYSGCRGGNAALAKPKQLIDIDIHLDGTTWVQEVVNRDTLDASDFSLDLKGQEQGRAFFALDLRTSNKPTEDILFTNTVLSMDRSDPGACEPVLRGTNDFASKARVSADGKHCCIDRIVLRASRVMATTTDPP